MIKYYFNVNDVRFHLLDRSILIISGWYRQNNPENNQVKIYLDQQELSFETNAYSGVEVRKKYLGLDSSVCEEYELYVRLPDHYDSAKELLIYTINPAEKRLSLSVPTADLKKKSVSIPHCIDQVSYDKETKECVITGWAISSESVTFAVESGSGRTLPYTAETLSRTDVSSSFRELNISAESGFKLTVPDCPPVKLTIKIKANDKETMEMILVGKSRPKTNYKMLFEKGIKYLRNYGVAKTYEKVKRKLKNNGITEIDYSDWRVKQMPTKEEIEQQKAAKFSLEPKFSIVVPLYRTPLHYLEEFIRSVTRQTYSNWELCLSDGSGADSPLTQVLDEYAANDKRIKVIHNQKQLRIAENTNAAIKAASGDFIVFADHDDLLSLDALYECVKAINADPGIEIIYSDEDKISMDGKTYFQPHFKSDFNIDLLRSMNYISHLFVVKEGIAAKAGLLDPAFDGAQDYDFIFRCIEQSDHIYHVPKVLYHWRAHEDSTAENPESKLYAFQAGERAIQAHYDRQGIKAKVFSGEYLGLYRTKYELTEEPLISIVIPNKDHTDDLEKCINSIENKSTYRNYEFIIVENNSEEATFAYYEKLKQANPKVKVVEYDGDFNYSRINNFGVLHASGDYILLLNNDTEIIHPDCLEEMLGYCMREDVGIVGARLYYGDDTIQHAGTVVGFGGIAGHTFIGYPRSANGYFSRIICAQDYSAVTAACLMVKKSVFEAVNGLSPELKVAFNDVDFCLKVREYGKLVVYNPYAEVYHYESKSRGLEDTPEKVKRFNNEIAIFAEKWPEILENGDPYYNPNLTLDNSDFSLNPN